MSARKMRKQRKEEAETLKCQVRAPFLSGLHA